MPPWDPAREEAARLRAALADLADAVAELTRRVARLEQERGMQDVDD